MGLFRVLLALSVATYHMGPLFGLEMLSGDLAVQVFYLISGFYMALILDGKYSATPYRVFIGNRILRLFPLYYVILAFILGHHALSYSRGVDCSYYIADCGKIHWESPLTLLFIAFTQVAILGQDWLFFLRLDPTGHLHFTRTGMDGAYRAAWLNQVGGAWTLGLELSFYLLAPFLMRRRSRVLVGLVAASLCLRVFLSYGLGLGQPWNYRFFPQELAFFLIGSLAYRTYRSTAFSELPHLGWLSKAMGTLGIAAIFLYPTLWRAMANPLWVFWPVIVACLPFLFHLTRHSRWDREIGELSYPIYLFHLPVSQLFGRFFAPSVPLQIGATVVVCAFFVKFLTKPIDAYRQKRVTPAEKAPPADVREHEPPVKTSAVGS